MRHDSYMHVDLKQIDCWLFFQQGWVLGIIKELIIWGLQPWQCIGKSPCEDAEKKAFIEWKGGWVEQ